jgi:four helix bundle protein
LDVYRIALAFQVFAAELTADRRVGALRDQLDRASVSIVLNIAEGAGRRSPADKSHLVAIAGARAPQPAAVMDLLGGRGLLPTAARQHGHALLVRTVQMLTRLIERQIP